MKISGAIFDLDGTLVDSMPVWDNFMTDFLRDFGIEAPRETEEKIMAMTVPTSIAYVRENFLPEYSYDELEKRIDDKVFKAYKETIPIKHGVKPFLFALRNKGVRMCIATSSPRRYAEAILKRLNLFHYFCCILSCEDLSTTKNSSDIYIRAHDILGTPMESTYVFEDAFHAVRTAKASGFKVVAIKDEASKNSSKEIKQLADVYIKDFDDFRGMV